MEHNRLGHCCCPEEHGFHNGVYLGPEQNLCSPWLKERAI